MYDIYDTIANKAIIYIMSVPRSPKTGVTNTLIYVYVEQQQSAVHDVILPEYNL